MQEVILYRKHANGIGTWRIWQDGDILRYAHALVMGGQEVDHCEQIVLNQSGRSIEEQIDLQMKSRINRQLDRGYVYSLEEAQKGKTNQLGLVMPMLALTPQKAGKIESEDSDLQFKLNGHRCLATRQDGEVILYSRQGKVIYLPHIATELQPILPEGATIDGELYHHGTSLQTIGSWIKKQQPESALIHYLCYDLVSKETFKDRYGELSSILKTREIADLAKVEWGKPGGFGPLFQQEWTGGKVKLLPCFRWVDDEQERYLFRLARNLGYEGLIKRINNRPYEDGKRSQSLIKIKEFLDCEVTVKSIRASKDGWAILCCETDDGKPVDCSAPGKVKEKEEVLRNKEDYIGRRVTIDYSELTEDGIPFHPTAREWKEEL